MEDEKETFQSLIDVPYNNDPAVLRRVQQVKEAFVALEIELWKVLPQGRRKAMTMSQLEIAALLAVKAAVHG